jgi:hypothetical protein
MPLNGAESDTSTGLRRTCIADFSMENLRANINTLQNDISRETHRMQQKVVKGKGLLKRVQEKK